MTVSNEMLLRGIAFAEARRNSARRILKPQNSGCEKDNTELTYDGVFQRSLGSKANTYSQSVGEQSPTAPLSIVSFSLCLTLSQNNKYDKKSCTKYYNVEYRECYY